MNTTPEFSRPLNIEGIYLDRPRTEKIEATVEECAALATRFDLRSLIDLKASITVLRVSEGRIIRVEGDLSADVVQACVVSLRDVPSRIQAHFETYFTEDGKGFDPEAEFDIDVEDELHDVMRGTQVDLGELVAQYLSLELDPYPRAPGVSLASQMAESGDGKIRPFAILAERLKDKKDK